MMTDTQNNTSEGEQKKLFLVVCLYISHMITLILELQLRSM